MLKSCRISGHWIVLEFRSNRTKLGKPSEMLRIKWPNYSTVIQMLTYCKNIIWHKNNPTHLQMFISPVYFDLEHYFLKWATLNTTVSKETGLSGGMHAQFLLTIKCVAGHCQLTWVRQIVGIKYANYCINNSVYIAEYG